MNPICPIRDIAELQRLSMLEQGFHNQSQTHNLWIDIDDDQNLNTLRWRKTDFNPDHFAKALIVINRCLEQWSGLLIKCSENKEYHDFLINFENFVDNIENLNLVQIQLPGNSRAGIMPRCSESSTPAMIDVCKTIRNTIQYIKNPPKTYIYAYIDRENRQSACVLARIHQVKVETEQFWKYFEPKSNQHVNIYRLLDNSSVNIPCRLLSWLKVKNLSIEKIFKNTEIYKAQESIDYLLKTYSRTWSGSWLKLKDHQIKPFAYISESENDPKVINQVYEALNYLSRLVENWSGLLANADFQQTLGELIAKCSQTLKILEQNNPNFAKLFQCITKMETLLGLSQSENFFKANYFDAHHRITASQIHCQQPLSSLWTFPQPLKFEKIKFYMIRAPFQGLVGKMSRTLLEKLAKLPVKFLHISKYLENITIRFVASEEGRTSMIVPGYVLAQLICDSELTNCQAKWPGYFNTQSQEIEMGLSIETFMDVIKIHYLSPEEQKSWGGVFELDGENILKILAAADYLDNPTLMNKCTRWLGDQIGQFKYPEDFESALFIYDFSLSRGLDPLMNQLWQQYFQIKFFYALRNKQWHNDFAKISQFILKATTSNTFLARLNQLLNDDSILISWMRADFDSAFQTYLLFSQANKFDKIAKNFSSTIFKYLDELKTINTPKAAELAIQILPKIHDQDFSRKLREWVLTNFTENAIALPDETIREENKLMKVISPPIQGPVHEDFGIFILNLPKTKLLGSTTLKHRSERVVWENFKKLSKIQIPLDKSIELNGVHPQTFFQLIAFLNGQALDLNDSNIKNMWDCAERLQMDEVKHQCIQWIMRRLGEFKWNNIELELVELNAYKMWFPILMTHKQENFCEKLVTTLINLSIERHIKFLTQTINFFKEFQISHLKTIHWEAAVPAHFKEICALTSLKSLSVSLAIKTEALGYLEGLKNLKTLELFNCQNLQVKDLEFLRKLNLEKLHLDNLSDKIQSEEGFHLLSQLPLEKLQLEDMSFNPFIETKPIPITDEFLKKLAHKRLHHLSLSYCHEIVGLGFSGLNYLRELRLDNCSKISDLSFAVLPTAMSQLERLELKNINFTDNYGWNLIGKITSLNSLIITDNDKITPSGLLSLTNLNKLELLSLNRCKKIQISEETLNQIRGLKNLTILNLAGCKILENSPTLLTEFLIDRAKNSKLLCVCFYASQRIMLQDLPELQFGKIRIEFIEDEPIQYIDGIGSRSGLYITGSCSCRKEMPWMFKGDQGSFDLQEIQATTPCPSCSKEKVKLLKVAMVGCAFNVLASKKINTTISANRAYVLDVASEKYVLINLRGKL